MKTTYSYLLQTNSGARKVFHAENLGEAKQQARKYFATDLVYPVSTK